MTQTQFCLVRHGETNWNAERRLQGQLDIALNAKGQAQAEAVAQDLAARTFHKIYSSDLMRTLQTAAPIARQLALPVEPMPALRERHFGDFQGLNHPEAQALFPQDYARFQLRDPTHAFPGGGERLRDFAARVAAALTDLAQKHPGETILVVTHGGVLDMARRLTMGQTLAVKRDYPLVNAGANWLAYEAGSWSLLSWAKEDMERKLPLPYDPSALPRREAARLLLINPRGEVLLFLYSSKHFSPRYVAQGFDGFWASLGGGLEQGESFEEAAIRELTEETGLTGLDVGPVVTTREFPMELGPSWFYAVEQYFAIRVEDFSPDTSGFTQLERAGILAHKWWSADEIAASGELIFPEGLEALLRRINV